MTETNMGGSERVDWSSDNPRDIHRMAGSCGNPINPEGAFLMPVKMVGGDRVYQAGEKLCENSPKYLVGRSFVHSWQEEYLNTETLEMDVRTREESVNSILCCGVHLDRAKRIWKAMYRPDDSNEIPQTIEIEDLSGDIQGTSSSLHTDN